MIRSLLLACSICFSISIQGLAQLSVEAILLPTKPLVRTYDPTEYGGHRQTWSIAQASDRTMGFANSDGLLLFDGSRWVQLPSPKGQELRSLVFRSADQQWIAGSYAALFAWPLDRLTNKAQIASELQPPTQPKEEWWQAVAIPEEQGSYYWQTFSKMIALRADNSMSEIELPGNIVFAQRLDDKLFLPVLGKGLYERQKGDWQLYSDHPSLLDVELVGIVKLGADTLLAATNTGRLLSIHGNEVSDWPSTRQQAWSQNRLNRLLKLTDGGYALGTIGKGIYILDDQGNTQFQLTDKDLGDGTVLSLFQDAAGDLWAGLDNGIAHITLSSAVQFVGQELGAVYDIELDPNGLFLATNQGLYKYSTEGALGSTSNPEVLISEQIWHLKPTQQGLLVGSNSSTGILNGNFIQRISSLPGGWCWLQLDTTTAFSGTYSGIERFVLKENLWRSEGSVANYAEPVKQLACSPNGGLLAVHPREGLFQLSLSDDYTQVTRVDHLDSIAGSIRFRSQIQHTIDKNRLKDLASISCDNGESIVYTNVKGQSSGFSKRDVYRSETDEFISIAEDNSIFHLHLRQNGLMLASDSNTLFYEAQPNLEYPSVKRIGDHQIAIGLTKGLAVLDLSKLAKQQSQPKPWVQTIRAGRGVRLEFGQPVFGKEPQWRVRLQGVDSSFTAWSERPYYDYPLLPAGNYTLHWESRDGESGTIDWTIPARWFETTWAYLSYMALGLLALWGLRVYYRRKLKREAFAAELERERQLTAERLRTRTAALEAEVEVSKREVALQHAEVEHRNRELARSTMTLARQNDTLLQLKDALNPLPKSGDIGKARRHIAHLIDGQLQSAEDWAFFDEHFNLVHAGFLSRLHSEYPDLTPGDLRLAALLRMNMASKEIAPLLHISIRGIENKRYRLRKKLGLDAEVNLTEWVLSY